MLQDFVVHYLVYNEGEEKAEYREVVQTGIYYPKGNFYLSENSDLGWACDKAVRTNFRVYYVDRHSGLSKEEIKDLLFSTLMGNVQEQLTRFEKVLHALEEVKQDVYA